MAWLFAVLVLASLLHPAYAMRRENVKLLTAHGTHVIDVEIADTPQEKAQGLMFRTRLEDNRGMLFAYDTPQEITMWMRNTYIPLDMVFIRADGRILRIAENTEPLSTRLIPSGGPVRAVLEVMGGTTRKLGIAPGDRVASPIFSAR